jgi:hypothetical protein
VAQTGFKRRREQGFFGKRALVSAWRSLGPGICREKWGEALVTKCLG